jgi:para-nitrobenzyl esterase
MDLFFTRKNIEAAKKLGRVIQGYWVNFAKTGDPNGEGLPEWPRFNKDDQNLMVLDEDVHAAKAECGERCAFWREWSKGPHSSTEMMR